MFYLLFCWNVTAQILFFLGVFRFHCIQTGSQGVHLLSVELLHSKVRWLGAGKNILFVPVILFPVNTNYQVCRFYLPTYRLTLRKFAPFAIVLILPLKHSSFYKFKANYTPSFIIYQPQRIGKAATVFILFKLIYCRRSFTFTCSFFTSWLLNCFEVKIILLSNKPSDLKVNEKEKLFPSHPGGNSDN